MSFVEPILQTRKARLRRLQSYSLWAAESGFNQRSAQLQSQFYFLQQCLEMLVRINPSIQGVPHSLSSLEVLFSLHVTGNHPDSKACNSAKERPLLRVQDQWWLVPSYSINRTTGWKENHEGESLYSRAMKKFQFSCNLNKPFHSFKDFDNLSPGLRNCCQNEI